jgi:CBS domain-containing protein
MQLKEIMTPQVEVIHPEAPIREAAAIMKALDVGSVPVYDGLKLQGMVTDRDITIRATAEGCDPRQTRVREVMTSEVLYCFEDQRIEEAALLMEEKQIRRLPVLNRNNELVGIVALGDLAVEMDDGRRVGQVLEGISEPAQPDRRP